MTTILDVLEAHMPPDNAVLRRACAPFYDDLDGLAANEPHRRGWAHREGATLPWYHPDHESHTLRSACRAALESS